MDTVVIHNYQNLQGTCTSNIPVDFILHIYYIAQLSDQSKNHVTHQTVSQTDHP